MSIRYPPRVGARGAVLLALLLPCLAVPPARGDDLDHALCKQAPAVIRFLREHGYRNAGVLKFQVRKGDGRPTDSAGLLNLNLARRLEVALILANPVEEKDPLGILRDASSVAAGISGANHLTEAGRQKLFAARYPLAWGNSSVEPDVFVTGVVTLQADRKRLEVQLRAVSKADPPTRDILKFTAASDARSLAESGESFLLRGGADDGQVVLVPEKAARVKAGQDEHPLQDESAPIQLEIRYNDRPIRVAVRDGQAEVPEPRAGQKVSFVLKRGPKANPKKTYGVVVKVNGENVLFRQRQPDIDCKKWIFEPGDGPTTIRGFQSTTKEARPFVVSAREESKANEFDYGADVGTITLTVFPEQQGRDGPALDLSEEGEDLPAIARGLLPPEPPKNLAALKAQLRSGTILKGLLEEGKEKVASGITLVKFQPELTPVLTATIRYYRP
jgi:hypothetical protein